MLAMPIHRDLPPATVRSLLETQGEMQRRNLDLTLDMTEGTSLIHHGRTAIAREFLNSNCTHLFFVDSDIAWKAMDFIKLIALGTRHECVCAAYPIKKDEIEFFVAYIDKKVVRDEVGLISIAGTGLGFTIIQRKVIEQLSAKAPKR